MMSGVGVVLTVLLSASLYAALFALRSPGDHPATVSLLWKKEESQWKIVAYDLTN